MASAKSVKAIGKDPFPGRPNVNKAKMKKYIRGDEVKLGNKSKFHKKVFMKSEKINSYSIKQAARSELLLPEEAGYLEADEGENTYEYRQEEIASAVDISSAAKHFDLKLRFGPYSMDYTRNGRQLLVGGKKGHVAAIDWITKKLLCEINVMESVHAVQWLHMYTMFATAQKDYVYMYDNQGIELHCIKGLHKVLNMEFLPYHFLLSTASENGYLSWLDISIGKMISQYNSKMGYLNVMCQNPYNAVVLTGHSNGTVAMWSPNDKKPLVKMLCHRRPVRAVQVDMTGKYMATAGVDGFMNIWDVRMLKQLQSYKLAFGASKLSFSQKGLLAVSIGNGVEIYKDCCVQTVEKPYLRHQATNTITGLKFCPYEDVLGISHNYGFTSILTPGSGEPNFDAFESNPYMTKNQRREMEVKSLLEKIQPELICLEPGKLGEVDVSTLKEKVESREKLLHLKPPKIEFDLKYKSKGKSGSGKKFKRKTIVKEQAKQNFVREEQMQKMKKSSQQKESKQGGNVLDRFKK